MAERDKKDKLADALNALAGGKPVEPEETPSEPEGLVDFSPAKPPARPDRPAVPGSVPPPPAPPAKPARPAAAGPAKPPASAPLFRAGTPPPPAKPAAPPRPAAPRPATPRPAAPGAPTLPPATRAPAPAPATPPPPAKPRVARPDRPAAPSVPSAPAAPVPTNDFVSAGNDRPGAISDDDDIQLDLPAATPDMLAHPPPRHRPAASVVASVSHSLAFKRTIIPILLTLGVLLPATASLKWVVGAGSPLSLLPSTVVIACCVVGAALLGVAGLNMLQVRDELARAAAGDARR
jgi:hypothetical protein